MSPEPVRLRLKGGWLLAAAAALMLALRFAYGFLWVGYPQLVQNVGGDAGDYLQLAYTLAKVDRYERPGTVDVKRVLQSRPASLPEPTGGEPDALRPPVWPWILSRCLRWSGYDLSVVFAFRFVLDAVTLVLFFRVVSPWLEPPLALLGTFLLALHPVWLYYSVTLLTEPLILLAHLLFTAAVLRLVEGGRTAVWLPVAGVLGGLAILTHGYFLFFPPFLVAGLWLARRLRTGPAVALLGLFVLTLTPWMARNDLVYGRPVLSTASGMNLAKGWNRRFLDSYRNGSAEVALDENAEIDPAELRGLNQAERSALYTSRSVGYVRTEWRTVPAILGKKLVGAVTPFSDPPRPGLLEAGRTLFQAVTLVPLLWVVFSYQRSSKRAGGWQPLPVVVRALAGAYLAMALACFPALRYRFPLIWAEVLSLCLFLQAFRSRFVAWRRSL